MHTYIDAYQGYRYSPGAGIIPQNSLSKKCDYKVVKALCVM